MSASDAQKCTTDELITELSRRGVQLVARVPGFDGHIVTPPGSPLGSVTVSGPDGLKLFEHINNSPSAIDVGTVKGALDAKVPS